MCVYIHSTDIYQLSTIKYQCRHLDYIFVDKIVKDPSFIELASKRGDTVNKKQKFKILDIGTLLGLMRGGENIW